MKRVSKPFMLHAKNDIFTFTIYFSFHYRNSGFFLAMNSVSVQYLSQMKWVFENGNCSSGVNQLCIQNNPNTPENCIFAGMALRIYINRKIHFVEWASMSKQSNSSPNKQTEYTAPWIQTPLFPLQPKYDYWQIFYVLGSTNVSQVNDFGELQWKTVLQTLLSSSVPHGIWFDSVRKEKIKKLELRKLVLWMEYCISNNFFKLFFFYFDQCTHHCFTCEG